MKSTKQQYLDELHKILNLQKDGKPVEIDSVPELFRKDLFRYIAGDTLQSLNGKVVIGVKRYQEWIKKIKSVGLDYVIQLENS